MISLEKRQILTHLQKLPKNVGDLGITLMPKALKSCPESNKSPNLVTLTARYKERKVQNHLFVCRKRDRERKKIVKMFFVTDNCFLSRTAPRFDSLFLLVLVRDYRERKKEREKLLLFCSLFSTFVLNFTLLL